MVGAEFIHPFLKDVLRKIEQERVFHLSKDLDPFAVKIFVEAVDKKTGTVYIV